MEEDAFNYQIKDGIKSYIADFENAILSPGHN